MTRERAQSLRYARLGSIGVRGAKGGNGIGDGVNGTVKAARCGRDEHGVDVEVLTEGVQGARVERRTPTDRVHMGIGKSGIRSGGSDRRTLGCISWAFACV
jgi:hypothetical protein